MKQLPIVLLLMVILVFPAWSLGCGSSSPEPELPDVYMSKTMKNIKFRYPVDWKDMTSEMEKGAGNSSQWEDEVSMVGWMDNSESAVLVAGVYDLVAMGMPESAVLTSMEKQQFAGAGPEMIRWLGRDVTVSPTREIFVGGELAFEIDFEGEFYGIDGDGYVLITFHDQYMFVGVFLVESKYMEKMRPIYDKVKDSVSLDTGTSIVEGEPTSEPTTVSTVVDMQTPSAVEDMEYLDYSLEGVRFSYPAGWRWSKGDLIVGAGAMWEDLTYSSMLYGVVTVWPELLKEEEKEEYAIEFGDETVAAIMDRYDTIITHNETEVAGEWALEMEIKGRVSGRRYVGYILSMFNQTTQFSIVYFVEETDWEELGGIYNEVKNSIEFGGGWTKRFGGRGEDSGASVLQASDGGYIITGMTQSYGAGKEDVWLVKTNPRGFVEWERTFGGAERDSGNAIQQTDDGGYIIVGCTESYGSGDKDLWLIKTGPLGYKDWENILGGRALDCGFSVQQTTDGDYVTVGTTQSYGTGTKDAWLVKFDSMGEVLWEETYGLDGIDEARSVQQTQDGGYIIAGQTSTVERGVGEIWLIKTDSEGKKEWDKTLGDGHGNAVIQLDDGGYFVAGSSLIKTDSEGSVVWEIPGESTMDEGTSVQQTSDGNFIITGHGREYTGGHLIGTVWLTKVDETGNALWISTYGGIKCDLAYSVQQTNDGGFIITGFTETFGVSGSGDLWLIKTDAQGDAE